MARVLVAALVAMIIAILGGPTFIAFLRRNEFGQHIREDGPQHHVGKQGTPTMGGLLILARRDDRVPPAVRLHAAGADDLRHRARLRRRSASSTTTSSCATALARAAAAAGRCCCCSAITVAVGLRRAPPAARPRRLHPGRRTGRSRSGRSGTCLLFLIIAGAVERREPHRRPRRPRCRDVDHRARDVHRDGGDDLHPLGTAAPRADREPARRRVHRRGADRGRASASSGSTRSRPRCSWATPARWRSGGAHRRDGDHAQGRAPAALRRRHLR